MKLYQIEMCPYCARVRAKIAELGIDCEIINVPRDKASRAELIRISGQPGVPTLVADDGRVIADDDDAIIAYLEQRYK
jgi:glutathione S-transferase